MAKLGVLRRIQILIGLGLTLVLPFTWALMGSKTWLAKHGNLLPGEVFWWGLIAVVLVYVLVIERRPLSSIGLRRPNWKTFAYAALAAGVMTVGVGFLMYVVMQHFHLRINTSALGKLMDQPYWVRLLIVLRAGIGEELFFRGYGIERLEELTGSKWIAGLVTLVVFTVAHIGFWGWTQILIAGSAGLVLTLLYLWRRDLVSNMIAHFLTDAAGLLLR